ncbi:hypothetical protein I2I11_04235 [Pontibacter sp. 172403-2]|uniref:hypothetical protein n=1 Tax=Pontibacter rufus TaxID=2791028 RepID=UPI0018AFEC52|nr:hypothetical protein [Pontibacter sp. 172403-2]MBF9252493.1 hypothetical protein [Pontibacter sp. 172403-2]
MAIYNPQDHIVQNKGTAVVGKPVDARSWWSDGIGLRPFASEAEVLGYFDTPASREGNFLIYIGADAYTFKGGTADENLVPFGDGAVDQEPVEGGGNAIASGYVYDLNERFKLLSQGGLTYANGALFANGIEVRLDMSYFTGVWAAGTYQKGWLVISTDHTKLWRAKQTHASSAAPVAGVNWELMLEVPKVDTVPVQDSTNAISSGYLFQLRQQVPVLLDGQLQDIDGNPITLTGQYDTKPVQNSTKAVQSKYFFEQEKLYPRYNAATNVFTDWQGNKIFGVDSLPVLNSLYPIASGYLYAQQQKYLYYINGKVQDAAGNPITVGGGVQYVDGQLVTPDGSEILLSLDLFPEVIRGYSYKVGDYFREGDTVYRVLTAFTSPAETYNSPTQLALSKGWLELFFESTKTRLSGSVVAGYTGYQSSILAGHASEKVLVPGPGATELNYVSYYPVIVGRTFTAYAELKTLDFSISFVSGAGWTTWVGDWTLPSGLVVGDTVAYEFKCFSYNTFTLVRKYIVGRSASTGTSVNTPGTTVERDSTGSFAGQDITAERVITEELEADNATVNNTLYAGAVEAGSVSITAPVVDPKDATTKEFVEGLNSSTVTQLRDGVTADGDTLNKQNLRLKAIEAIIGDATPDADTVVNKLNEALEILQNYPEGTNLLGLIAGKADKADIYNALDAITPGKMLDATQGKVLMDAINTLAAELDASKWTEAKTLATKLTGYVKAAASSALATTTGFLQALGILEYRLDNLDVGKATTGTLPDARLSSNVPLKNAQNTFTQQQTFNQVTFKEPSVETKTAYGITSLGSGNILPLILDTYSDAAQFAPVIKVEYLDQATQQWTPWVGGETPISRLLDGQPLTATSVTTEKRHWRFVIKLQAYHGGGLFQMYQEYGVGGPFAYTMKVEHCATSDFASGVTEVFNEAVSAGSYFFNKAITAFTPNTYYRIDIDVSSTTVDSNWRWFKLLTSRVSYGTYSGLPFGWDYTKKVTFEAINSKTIQENGVALADKYAGKDAINLYTQKQFVRRSLATDSAFAVEVFGDAQSRSIIFADGLIEWGNGDSVRDVNLFRAASGLLQTNGAINAVGGFRENGVPLSTKYILKEAVDTQYFLIAPAASLTAPMTKVVNGQAISMQDRKLLTPFESGSIVEPTLNFEEITNGKNALWLFKNRSGGTRPIHLPTGVAITMDLKGSAILPEFDKATRIINLPDQKNAKLYVSNDGENYDIILTITGLI